MTAFHTGNPYGSLSDQKSEIIEVLIAEGTSPHCLYEAVHTLYPPVADVEGGPWNYAVYPVRHGPDHILY